MNQTELVIFIVSPQERKEKKDEGMCVNPRGHWGKFFNKLRLPSRYSGDSPNTFVHSITEGLRNKVKKG